MLGPIAQRRGKQWTLDQVSHVLQEKLRVRIRRGSVDIEASGESQEDLEQALKAGIASIRTVVPLLQEMDAETHPKISRSEAETPSSTARHSAVAPDLSVGEILWQANVSTDTDRCLIMSYYLFRRGHREFTHRDLLKLYDESGTPHPTNVYDVLSRLVKRTHLRLLDEQEGVKSFTITQSGLAHSETMASPSRPGESE